LPLGGAARRRRQRGRVRCVHQLALRALARSAGRSSPRADAQRGPAMEVDKGLPTVNGVGAPAGRSRGLAPASARAGFYSTTTVARIPESAWPGTLQYAS